MSRYVHVPLQGLVRDEVTAALTRLGIPHRVGELMLEGSLECAGEPVDVAIDPASVGAVEDFGLRVDDGTLVLVCGELDRDHLVAQLLAQVREQVAVTRLEQAGVDAALVKLRRG
jgi:hypothetical protein